MTDLPIKIRPMEPGDKGLIVVSWVNSYRDSVPWIPREDYNRLYRQAVCRVLDQSEVFVACSPDFEEQVFGWVCGEPERNLLHYVFVKSDYRLLGVGRRLLSESLGSEEASIKYTILDREIEATHWTLDGSKAGLTVGYRPDLLYAKEKINAGKESTTGVRPTVDGRAEVESTGDTER